MEDKILIRNLTVRGILGVNDWEREKKQEIEINLELTVDIRPAAETDRIEDAVNYRTISKKVIRHVRKAERHTVEALVTDIARLCLEMEGVEKVTARVEKPGALRFSDSVGVEITRSDPVGDNSSRGDRETGAETSTK